MTVPACSSARVSGGYESTGVIVAGVPAVAPVAGGPDARVTQPPSSGGATLTTMSSSWSFSPMACPASSGPGFPSVSSVTL